MESKEKLSDKLSIMEVEILTKSNELDSIRKNLKIAYDYLEVVTARIKTANQNIDGLQIEFIDKTREIKDILRTMKWTVGEFESKLLNT